MLLLLAEKNAERSQTFWHRPWSTNGAYQNLGDATNIIAFPNLAHGLISQARVWHPSLFNLLPSIQRRKIKNSAHILTSCLWLPKGHGNFRPEEGFQGFGGGPATAWAVVSVWMSEFSSSICWTLWEDFAGFLTPIVGTSLGVGSDLELSFVLRSVIHTFLKQLNAAIPTGFLKSKRAAPSFLLPSGHAPR